MEFKSKLLVVALAAAMPWVSAQAQTQADLQKEIAALRAQLQALQQKVESLNTKADTPAAVTAVSQQVNRLEQRLDLADDAGETTGFKGLKINGTIEAGFAYDSSVGSHNFDATSGYVSDSVGSSGRAMIQITKESQGEGVDWTLRLLPGADSIVHEASVSIPLDKENRVIGGVMPDFQGYEFSFPNSNSTLGNQLISHNALYDIAGASQYSGLGMTHSFDDGTYAFKWLVGNVDAKTDTDNDESNPNVYSNGSNRRSVALAYRGDWFASEFAYVGFSGLHGSVNRNFRIMAIDGGYSYGDWQFNGQISNGWMRNAAINGRDAEWTGISGLMGYKVSPRLQVIYRIDYLLNSKNGGGTYAYPGVASDSGLDKLGLGQEKDANGNLVSDSDGVEVGANLMRLTMGANYQINANTQWKFEYLVDRSSGYNFKDIETGKDSRVRSRIGTAVVLSF